MICPGTPPSTLTPCPASLTGISGLAAAEAVRAFAEASLQPADVKGYTTAVDRKLSKLSAENVTPDGKGSWQVQYCSGNTQAASSRLTFYGDATSCVYKCEVYKLGCTPLAATIDTDKAVNAAFAVATPTEQFKVELGGGPAPEWTATRKVNGQNTVKKTPAK